MKIVKIPVMTRTYPHLFKFFFDTATYALFTKWKEKPKKKINSTYLKKRKSSSNQNKNYACFFYNCIDYFYVFLVKLTKKIKK